jgi:membrane associated rhomboid family serine protease
VALYLADIPYFTVYYCQIWRLITTPFITTGILSIIFSLLFWYKDAVKLERDIGTVKYILIFFMNSLFIQILYCLVTFLISLIIQSNILMKMKITPLGVVNAGLWPILLCDLTLLCLSNPEENMKFFIFPCIIKARYYPLVLFLIFTILSGFNIDFENLCGIGFGYLYHYYLKNKLAISNNFALKVENSFLCRWMRNKKGFIKTGGIGTQLVNSFQSVRNVVITNSKNLQKGFNAFQGKGVAVGGSDANIKNNTNKDNKPKINYSNVSVSSNEEINTTDSRVDLNTSKSNN